MPLRLIFMGTPEFAVPTLRALYDAGHEIVAVYTREPMPGGRRGLELQQTPVEKEARRLDIRIPVETPKTLRTSEAIEKFHFYQPDAAVVVAYGMILPQAILDVPAHGCFNLHASRLPHWRGAAPINRAIMAGDNRAGVMVMKMDAGLDTGEVARTNQKRTIKITNDMTAAKLHDELAVLGAELMTWAIGALERGKLRFKKQKDEELSYAAKIDKAEARIDWNKPRAAVLRHVNGLSPFPGAWCELPIKSDMMRLKILRCSFVPGPARKLLPRPGTLLDDRLAIACTDGAIRILDLQLAGGQAMNAAEFLLRTPLKPPLRLS
jgi:methionyl-tRNA formyltransferase